MKRNETLYNIVIGVLFAAALIFIGISIFTRMENTVCLFIGILCSLLGNLLNLIKMRANKKGK